MAKPRTAPGEDLLRRAYTLMRGPGWPASYEAALQWPLYERLLQARARGLALADEALRTVRPLKPQAPVVRRQWPFLVPKPAPGAFDPRRAAANDFDEVEGRD